MGKTKWDKITILMYSGKKKSFLHGWLETLCQDYAWDDKDHYTDDKSLKENKWNIELKWEGEWSE